MMAKINGQKVESLQLVSLMIISAENIVVNIYRKSARLHNADQRHIVSSNGVIQLTKSVSRHKRYFITFCCWRDPRVCDEGVHDAQRDRGKLQRFLVRVQRIHQGMPKPARAEVPGSRFDRPVPCHKWLADAKSSNGWPCVSRGGTTYSSAPLLTSRSA